MSIKAMEMYTVICDRCGADANADADYSCWNEEDVARDMAIDADDWRFIDGKDYCHACLDYEVEADEWVPKLEIVK